MSNTSRNPILERWPASSVELWPIGRLRQYGRNTKKHPPEQIEQLRASMREFGFTIPVLARSDGRLIAGHGRLEAAIAEGYVEVPVIVAHGWTEEQCRAYGIADNRLTEAGEWDEDLLKLELGDLKAAGFDVELTGYTGTDLDRLLGVAVADGIEDPPADRYQEQYGVVVICADEAAQQRAYDALREAGYNCRVVAT